MLKLHFLNYLVPFHLSKLGLPVVSVYIRPLGVGARQATSSGGTGARWVDGWYH